MDGVEPGEYSVTVGDTVKSDRKGKETFQILTWGKPKPESVKDFKAPGIFWKAHEKDETTHSKIPIYLRYTTKDGEKGGEHKFQAASVKKNAKNTHECIVFLDANGTARIERLQGSINLNEKVGQVPDSRPKAPDTPIKRKYSEFFGESAGRASPSPARREHDAQTLSDGEQSSSESSEDDSDDDGPRGAGKGLMGPSPTQGGKGLLGPSPTGAPGGGKGLMGAGGKGLLSRPAGEGGVTLSDSESESESDSD